MVLLLLLLFDAGDLRYLASKDGEDADWLPAEDASSWLSFLMKTNWLLLVVDDWFDTVTGLLDADETG